MRRPARAGPIAKAMRVSVFAGGLVAAIVAAAGGTVAEDRSIDAIARVDTSQQREQQAAFVRDLKAAAARYAKPDTDEYWAFIRANLAAPRQAPVQSGERSAGAGTQPRFQLPDAGTLATSAEADKVRIETHLEKLENGERIFGGKPTLGTEFHEVVSLAHYVGGKFDSFCSGTLVARGTVLTAAHCVCDAGFQGAEADRPAVVFGANVNKIESVAAAFRVKSATTRNLAFCKEFNEYDTATLAGRDIAIVKFDYAAKAELVRGALPRPAPRIAKIVSWRMLFGAEINALDLVGYGYAEDKVLVGEKRFTTAPIFDPICSAKAQTDFNCSLGAEAVAIDAGQMRDTCNGDSGGPAFIRTDLKDHFLAAVTSRGSAKDGKCGAGGIYSLMTPELIAWLKNETDIETCDSPSRCWGGAAPEAAPK